MRDTELEKIVQSVFESVNHSSGEKIWRTYSLRDENGKFICFKDKDNNETVYNFPWLCSTDNEFLNFLEEPHYFYRCICKGMRVEYVVVPHFYSLIDHSTSCENPKVCGHTTEYVRELLLKSDSEIGEIIDQTLCEQRFSDRLQFLWGGETKKDPHIFNISSTPKLELLDSGYFELQAVPRYCAQRFNGMKKLSTRNREVFSKIEAVFKEGVSRVEVLNYQWKFGSLLKEAMTQNYDGKKAD